MQRFRSLTGDSATLPYLRIVNYFTFRHRESQYEGAEWLLTGGGRGCGAGLDCLSPAISPHLLAVARFLRPSPVIMPRLLAVPQYCSTSPSQSCSLQRFLTLAGDRRSGGQLIAVISDFGGVQRSGRQLIAVISDFGGGSALRWAADCSVFWLWRG